LRTSTSLSFSVAAVALALGVGAAGATLAPSLLSALESVNSSPNEPGAFDNRQKVYNRELYSALQALDQRVTSLEGPTQPPPSPPPPPSEPAPIAGQGYTVKFTDQFNTLDRSVWCNRQWYEPTPVAATQFVDADGVLHLTRRRVDGFRNTTVSSEPCGQANPKSYQYGYFEARMRWDGVRGNGPAIWIFSTRHAENGDGVAPDNWPNVSAYCAQNGLPNVQCISAEIDVFEGYGYRPDVTTGTIHRNSCGCYGFASQSNAGVNSWRDHAFNVAPDWHVYGLKWTPAEVVWYLDGVETHRYQTFDSTSQPLHLILSNWNTDWEPGNSVTSVTPDVVHNEVDWVRVWQK
jgi:hypothetical protein